MNTPGKRTLVLAIVMATGAAACGGSATPSDASIPATVTQPGAPPSVSSASAPAVSSTDPSPPDAVAADPSSRVVAFYYPWYDNPDSGGVWGHWDQENAQPPGDIGSDFYPELGAYSSLDPVVVSQHFAWLREAGVGVIASSWWGRSTKEDRAVNLLLDTAAKYGIAVAFHIEPYADRTAAALIEDVAYLYDRYGEHPAFFRTTETSRWSADDRAKGLFFVWSSSQPNGDHDPVEAEYWREAVDAIHALPDGGLVIADTPRGDWVDGGHFDGLYQYATLSEEPRFDWARSLPPGAWYVPSVIPGFSARRIRYDDSTYTRRADGDTYRNQWHAALDAGVEPKLVTITSFNEWHEGTQIEPAAADVPRPAGEGYDSYGPLGPEGYIEMTADLIAEFEAIDWGSAAVPRVRISITTSSDWTTLTFVSGGRWLQPETGHIDEAARLEQQGRLVALFQPLDEATAGKSVTASFDVGVLDSDALWRLRIERGALGFTEVTIVGVADDAASSDLTVRWDGWSDALVDGETGRNPFEFEVKASDVVPGR